MKRMNITHLKVAIALAISVLTGSVHAAPVYLQNSYSADIAYNINQIPTLEQDKTLLKGNKVQIGDVAGFYRGSANLSIRTTGMGSSVISPYTNLSGIINQINAEASSHHKVHQVIIDVSGYRIGYAWNVKVLWQ